MKNIHFLLLLIAFLGTTIPSISQAQPSLWEKLNALTGDWIAEGGGQPGQGNGSFSFSYDLGNRIMIRKNSSAYPAVGNKNAIVHEDLMIIYGVDPGQSLQAIYFDNEGHSISYAIDFKDDKTIQFISEIKQNQPAFRLTYHFSDRNNMTVGFEIASDGNPTDFKTYVTGLAHRKN
jgi:hypothetical protein